MISIPTTHVVVLKCAHLHIHTQPHTLINQHVKKKRTSLKNTFLLASGGRSAGKKKRKCSGFTTPQHSEFLWDSIFWEMLLLMGVSLSSRTWQFLKTRASLDLPLCCWVKAPVIYEWKVSLIRSKWHLCFFLLHLLLPLCRNLSPVSLCLHPLSVPHAL